MQYLSAMPIPPTFAAKSTDAIREELLGFPATTVDAALSYHAEGSDEALLAMLPGMLAYHLPRGSA